MGGETALSRTSATSAYPQKAAGPVGKKIHSIYTSRLRIFTDDGQYYNDSLMSFVSPLLTLGSDHFKCMHR
jgi:alpha-mannosidase